MPYTHLRRHKNTIEDWNSKSPGLISIVVLTKRQDTHKVCVLSFCLPPSILEKSRRQAVLRPPSLLLSFFFNFLLFLGKLDHILMCLLHWVEQCQPCCTKWVAVSTLLAEMLKSCWALHLTHSEMRWLPSMVDSAVHVRRWMWDISLYKTVLHKDTAYVLYKYTVHTVYILYKCTQYLLYKDTQFVLYL